MKRYSFMTMLILVIVALAAGCGSNDDEQPDASVDVSSVDSGLESPYDDLDTYAELEPLDNFVRLALWDDEEEEFRDWAYSINNGVLAGRMSVEDDVTDANALIASFSYFANMPDIYDWYLGVLLQIPDGNEDGDFVGLFLRRRLIGTTHVRPLARDLTSFGFQVLLADDIDNFQLLVNDTDRVQIELRNALESGQVEGNAAESVRRIISRAGHLLRENLIPSPVINDVGLVQGSLPGAAIQGGVIKLETYRSVIGQIGVLQADYHVEEGHNLSFQWYRIIDGEEEPIPGATESFHEVSLDVEGTFEFFFTITIINPETGEEEARVVSPIVRLTIRDTTPQPYEFFDIFFRGYSTNLEVLDSPPEYSGDQDIRLVENLQRVLDIPGMEINHIRVDGRFNDISNRGYDRHDLTIGRANTVAARLREELLELGITAPDIITTSNLEQVGDNPEERRRARVTISLREVS
ncbi:MAG: hypothetical protein FWG65_11575 [Turicibacter sp.]|nr:hypothetical protein [Turicibacter sp.]